MAAVVRSSFSHAAERHKGNYIGTALHLGDGVIHIQRCSMRQGELAVAILLLRRYSAKKEICQSSGSDVVTHRREQNYFCDKRRQGPSVYDTCS